MASRPARIARNRMVKTVAMLAVLAASPAFATGTISIAWDPVVDETLAGYRVFVGEQSGSYGAEIDVAAEQTAMVLDGLASCTEYFVAVRSIGDTGELSPEFSNELAAWPVPQLTGVTPPEARAGKTAVLTLAGVNIRAGATVQFEDPLIQVVETEILDCRTVQVTVELDPSAVVGSTSGVTIDNPDGTWAEIADVLLVLPQWDLTSGLIAHWSMDADSIDNGLLLDSSGSDHHGEMDDGVTTEPGKIGEALRFGNGHDHGIVVADSDELDLAGPFTIAAWIKADTFGQQQNGVIISKFNGSRVEGWSFELWNGGGDGSQRAFGLTLQSVVEGEPDTSELFRWQHLALTHDDAGTMTFWVDGLPSKTVDVSHAPNPGLRHVTIGNNKVRGADFDGLIDELRLYDRVLEGGAIALLAEIDPPEETGTDKTEPTDTVGTDPGGTDPGGTDPGGTDPGGTDPGGTDPGGTDPGGTDPGGTDPGGTEPGGTDPGGTGPDDGTDECDPVGDGEPDTSDSVDLPGGANTETVPPIAHWSMDVGTIDADLVQDVSGNGHHGEMIGVDVEPGRFGDALRFHSTQNDYVVVPDADALDLTGDAFTISAWIWLDTFGEGRMGSVLSKFFPARTEGWELSLEGSQLLGLRVYGLTHQSDIESMPEPLVLRTWHHVAIVHEAGWLDFWVDGVWFGSFETMHDPNPGLRGVYIGNNKSRTADFDGLIDEVAIWDVALDDAEVQALAAGPVGADPAP